MFEAWQEMLGSAGCQPAVLGSLPSTRCARAIFPDPPHRLDCTPAAGRLPAAAGWQPALPKRR
jgi:hypothetical protein